MTRTFNVRDKRCSKRYFIDNALLRGGWGKEIGPYGLAVYNALAIHANVDTQDAWPSHNLIAKLTGMSRPTVTKAISALEAFNIIAVDRSGHNHIYFLVDRSEWRPVDGDSESKSVNQADIPDESVNAVDTSNVNAVDTNNTHATKLKGNNTHDPPDDGREEKPKRKRSANDDRKLALETYFSTVAKIPRPPTGNAKQRRRAGVLWWTPLMAMAKACDNDTQRTMNLIAWTLAKMDRDNLTVTAPNSIVNIAIAEQAKRKRQQEGTLDFGEPEQEEWTPEQAAEQRRIFREIAAQKRAEKEREALNARA